MSFLLSGVAATSFSFWSKDSFSWPTWPPSDSWSSCLCLLVLILGSLARLFKPKESAGRETTTKALSSLLVLALRRAVDSFLLCRAPSAASASRRDRSAALSRTSLRFPQLPVQAVLARLNSRCGERGEKSTNPVLGATENSLGEKKGKIPNVSSREPETGKKKMKIRASWAGGGTTTAGCVGCKAGRPTRRGQDPPGT